jgi:hypothetical protein
LGQKFCILAVEVEEEEKNNIVENSRQQIKLLVGLLLLPTFFNGPNTDEKKNKVANISKIPPPQLANLIEINDWIFPKVSFDYR